MIPEDMMRKILASLMKPGQQQGPMATRLANLQGGGGPMAGNTLGGDMSSGMGQGINLEDIIGLQEFRRLMSGRGGGGGQVL